jgi:hypothetical protein
MINHKYLFMSFLCHLEGLDCIDLP